MTAGGAPAKLVFNAIHVPPPSTERKTWLPVLAYSVDGTLGLMARTETLPPYSGSCVQIFVSAACTAGERTSIPERLRARHTISVKTKRTGCFIVNASFRIFLLLLRYHTTRVGRPSVLFLGRITLVA